MRFLENKGFNRIFIVYIVFIILLIPFLIDTAYSQWWNTSFDYRKDINVTNLVSENLTNYPLLINISYDSLMLSNFSDMRFTNGTCDSNNQTLMPYEFINVTSTYATLWINIPDYRSGNNNICMYYNNNTVVGSGENASYVWRDFSFAVHMDDAPTGLADDVLDSSPNSNHFTSTGTMNSADSVKGIVGNAIDFDGGDDLLEDLDGETYINGLDAVTVMVWIQADAISSDKPFFDTDVPDNSDDYLGMRYDISGVNSNCTNCVKSGISTTNEGSNNVQTESSSNTQTTDWSFVTLRWHNGSWMDFFFDGVRDTGADYEFGNGTGTIDGSNRVIIGSGAKGTGNNGWDGLIDEFRLTNRSLSNQWINMSYLMIVNNSEIISEGRNYTRLTNLNIWDESEKDGSPYSNEDIEPGEYMFFFANYTNRDFNLTTANCSINFSDGQTGTMSYNSTMGFYTYETNFSTDGLYNYSIVCNQDWYVEQNASGNMTIIDVIAPVVNIHSPINNTKNFNEVLLNFSMTDSNPDSIWYFNGTDNVSYSSSTYINLSPGRYNWRVYANDTYGNMNFTNLNFTVIDSSDFTVNKLIESINTNQHIIKLDIRNNLNQYKEGVLYDFLPIDYISGSFNQAYDDNYTTSGVFNGEVYLWNLSFNPFETIQINYSITHNLNSTKLIDLHIFGFS